MADETLVVMLEAIVKNPGSFGPYAAAGIAQRAIAEIERLRAQLAPPERSCTCHPSEAPVPCQKKYAYGDCKAAAAAPVPQQGDVDAVIATMARAFDRGDMVAAHNAIRADRQRAVSIAMNNIRSLWSDLRQIREVVETLGPVGAMRSGEAVDARDGPTSEAEAAEIIRGIQRIADDSQRAVDAAVEVRRKQIGLLANCLSHIQSSPIAPENIRIAATAALVGAEELWRARGAAQEG